jgi:hypothetical protein
MSRLFFCANNARIVEIGSGIRQVNGVSAPIGNIADDSLLSDSAWVMSRKLDDILRMQWSVNLEQRNSVRSRISPNGYLC